VPPRSKDCGQPRFHGPRSVVASVAWFQRPKGKANGHARQASNTADAALLPLSHRGVLGLPRIELLGSCDGGRSRQFLAVEVLPEIITDLPCLERSEFVANGTEAVRGHFVDSAEGFHFEQTEKHTGQFVPVDDGLTYRFLF
jgi:hypothetical protein